MFNNKVNILLCYYVILLFSIIYFFHFSFFIFQCKFYFNRCKNRYLDFQRSLAITSDLQRVKLQEYIDPDIQSNMQEYENDVDGPSVILTPNVPRTFEVELRGEELVDSCVSGDIVIMVGIVKAVQQVYLFILFLISFFLFFKNK